MLHTRSQQEHVFSHRPPLLMACAVALLAGGAGCESLPGTDEQQGAVIGGAGGAAVGAAVTENRLLGGLIGGVAGAGLGYIIGANSDRILGNDTEGARQAEQEARRNPATAADARNARTADLDGDGFVTIDELLAMDEAGLSDDEIVQRLERTNQVFELTPEQEEFLIGEGLGRDVVIAMRTINQEQRDEVYQQMRSQRISRPS